MYIEGNALILGDSSYLEHHGILGQKWGVRRFQNKDGTRTAAGKDREDRRVLKKGTTVKRTSYGMYDETYDNKKYVSTNDDDAGKWSRYIGEAKARQGAVVFENEYQLTRDVAVATGKDICKIIDSEFKNADVTKLKEDTDYAARALRQDLNNMSREERVSLNFAMQTQSGKKIVKLLKKHGYDALEDDHGKNVSKDPVIILDPKKNMKRTRVTANANYYFDYINHTSIDDSPYLSHHGIKGQRWGVRRFQNKDGTRTAAGKKRDAENLKSSQEAKNVNSKIHSYINKQLSSEDLDTGKSNYDFASNLIKDPDFEKVIMPVVQDIRQTKAKYGNKEPYEFTGDEHQAYMNDIDRLDKKTGELAIAIGLAEKGEPNKKSTPPEGEYERVDMFRYALARYLDEHSPDGYSDEGDWIYHSSMEGTFFIEDGTLYLSHHGIRGQRWGVRRFQNKDGSLTNAGRKRLGYATKGATQAVKKAFDAGVKTGAKAVKAAKAHHEKAEAKKIEKKKEKASKTRAGVYANKDLFTAKELKELNSKFEEQDKLLKARMEKGVEIAKAVGEYAKTAKQIGDAYQSITGKNILTHLTEIKEANETKAKEAKNAADKAKAEEDAAAKKAESKSLAKEALQKNIDAFKADQESNERIKDLEKQGNKTAAKVKLAEYIDRYNQDQAAQEATKQMMKNQKLQEYIDRANQAQREKDSATLKETTDRGKQVIDLLQRHSTDSDLFKEDYQNRVANADNSTKPSSAPDDSNLMSLVRKANASNSLSTNSTSRSKDSDDLMAKNRESKAVGDIKDASERASKAIDLLSRKDRITNGNSNNDESTSVSTPSMNDLAKLIRAANSANSKSGPTIEKSQWQRDLEEKTRQLKSDDDNRKLANNLDSIKKAASDASKAANSKSNDPSETTQKLLANNAKKLDYDKLSDNGNRDLGKVFGKALVGKEQRAPNLQKLEAAQKKWKSSSDPSLRKKYMKIVSEELQYLSDDEFDLYMAGKLFKHSAFSDPNFIEHYGVRGMKWGKHLMAGKGGDIYDGTALGAGGGGGPMTEEERKKAEELRKKKLEEAKKKAEEAAKEKEIEEKAKEIGISAKAYKRYSIDNNRLPGKHHYDKSQKLHGEASSSVAEARAADRQAHMNRAKAASLNRKVNSSHMFDSQGYHISQQRADDRKEAKRLRKEAKQLDAKSKKALKKFYKKRYKADKERQKWQSSTSGKYHHLMRHYEIQNGVLFIDSSDGFAHHGVKGQRWGVRRFQNEDGSLTPKGRKHYEKKIEKLKRKQTNSDSRRGELERRHPFAVAGASVLGGIAGAATGAAVAGVIGAAVIVPTPVTIAAGAAAVAAISAGITHASYSVSEAWEGRGTRIRKKKIAKYENMLKQSDMEEGMYHVENGTLFINAGEPYLEHHGVLGMKWGKHLRAGKGPADAPASAGGGGGEDDEKLKEMAKKAGMSVAEYRTKMASKLSGAASKVGEKVYDAAGGSHKKNAEGWRKMAQDEYNAARASEKSSHENSAKAASQDRKYGSGGDVYRRAADSDKENAETHRSNAKSRSERAASEQKAYEKSLAGRYDKMKADQARKKSARQDKAFSGTSPKEKKRVGRKDQYLALPEQKKRSRAYDNKDAGIKRARAERLTRDSEIFNRTAEELKRKQNSALNKGNKQEAERKGKDAQFAQDWAEEGRRGAKDWRTGRRTGKPVLRTDSLDQVKKQHDKTLSGKLDKARHTIQRGKQKVYNAAGGKYKEGAAKQKVLYDRAEARKNRATKMYNKTTNPSYDWDRQAADSAMRIHNYEAGHEYSKYRNSLAGRYDEFKEKRKKKKAKHFDDTNAIYTEGAKLVVNSKWG